MRIRDMCLDSKVVVGFPRHQPRPAHRDRGGSHRDTARSGARLEDSDPPIGPFNAGAARDDAVAPDPGPVDRLSICAWQHCRTRRGRWQIATACTARRAAHRWTPTDTDGRPRAARPSGHHPEERTPSADAIKRQMTMAKMMRDRRSVTGARASRRRKRRAARRRRRPKAGRTPPHAGGSDSIRGRPGARLAPVRLGSVETKTLFSSVL